MQIVSKGRNLHVTPKPISWENRKKIKTSPAEMITQQAKD